ncbi:hypothetical protein HAZT_HAZT007506 [Hyalella azteca]|uniref:U2A'/phosphoprotein 32 family A C-terminal domain-containing protein n=1 Tax=Hyalella azteca TaxID=294128 RepID=A0A6A0HDD2_HYAAZ|nr:hypothetical protein HAZT_HAZT007506 [Hyalella azteca]
MPIEELNLDNCKSASVIGLSEEWSSLQSLSLINVGLTSLKSFPALDSLKKLELSDNWISGGLEALTCLPKLKYLNLSGNKITNIDTLKPLKSISSLVTLDLFNCDVVNVEDYRNKVFDLIPSLVYLDGFDREGNELDDEDDEDDTAANVREDGDEEGEELDEEEDVDDEDEEDDDEEDEEGDDDEEFVPLDAIYKNYDPEGDRDYEAVEDGEDEDVLDEEEDDDNPADATTNSNDLEGGGGRGKKRKHEGEEDQ